MTAHKEAHHPTKATHAAEEKAPKVAAKVTKSEPTATQVQRFHEGDVVKVIGHRHTENGSIVRIKTVVNEATYLMETDDGGKKVVALDSQLEAVDPTTPTM